MVKEIHAAVAAFVLALAAPAGAQEARPDGARLDPAQAAMAEFYDCAKRYSEKYSRSREPAQDIADAALSYCETPRERARTLLIEKLSVGGRSARDQVNGLFPGIIEKARLLSIRTVVESRYEASLRAASAPPAAPAPLAPAPPVMEKPLAPPPPAVSTVPAAPAVSTAPAAPPSPAVSTAPAALPPQPPTTSSPAVSPAPSPSPVTSPTASPAPPPAAATAASPATPPASPPVAAAPPSGKPDEAVAMPYIDTTQAPPPAAATPAPATRPDPGGFPPEFVR